MPSIALFLNSLPSQARLSRLAFYVSHDVDARKNQNAFIRALDPLAKKRSLQVIFLGKVKKNGPTMRNS